jgi:hypothetical protein
MAPNGARPPNRSGWPGRKSTPKEVAELSLNGLDRDARRSRFRPGRLGGISFVTSTDLSLELQALISWGLRADQVENRRCARLLSLANGDARLAARVVKEAVGTFPERTDGKAPLDAESGEPIHTARRYRLLLKLDPEATALRIAGQGEKNAGNRRLRVLKEIGFRAELRDERKRLHEWVWQGGEEDYLLPLAKKCCELAAPAIGASLTSEPSALTVEEYDAYPEGYEIDHLSYSVRISEQGTREYCAALVFRPASPSLSVLTLPFAAVTRLPWWESLSRWATLIRSASIEGGKVKKVVDVRQRGHDLRATFVQIAHPPLASGEPHTVVLRWAEEVPRFGSSYIQYDAEMIQPFTGFGSIVYRLTLPPGLHRHDTLMFIKGAPDLLIIDFQEMTRRYGHIPVEGQVPRDVGGRQVVWRSSGEPSSYKLYGFAWQWDFDVISSKLESESKDTK